MLFTWGCTWESMRLFWRLWEISIQSFWTEVWQKMSVGEDKRNPLQTVQRLWGGVSTIFFIQAWNRQQVVGKEITVIESFSQTHLHVAFIPGISRVSADLTHLLLIKVRNIKDRSMWYQGRYQMTQSRISVRIQMRKTVGQEWGQEVVMKDIGEGGVLIIVDIIFNIVYVFFS